MDPPFIKLYPEQRHGSKGSDSSDGFSLQSSLSGSQSTAQSTPPGSPPAESGTHNTSRARYHMKDIGEFAEALELSANRALPNRGLTRYKDVQVLLLRWEEDELEVEWELNDLAKVFRDYGFSTDPWLIPTQSPLRKMMAKALKFIDDHESPDTLLIVYYGGHAKINEARQSTWSCTRNMNYSSFEWNACQSLFEQSTSDTLFLFDCCSAAAAASSVPSRTNAITETIAACGWETWAPEPGRHSFTNALIEVLEEWIDRKSFSAAMLHSEILSVLKATRPKKRLEISKTPIYIVTTSNPKTCSIEIRKRGQCSISQSYAQSEESVSTSGQTSVQAMTSEPLEAGDEFDLSSLVATLPDNTFALPHIIMSVALESDQMLDVSGFEQWMKDFPALAKYAKIQGVYQSYSTLVLLSVPVVVWNLLPENSACNFVGYTKSDNLLTAQLKSNKEKPIEVFDNMEPMKRCLTEMSVEPVNVTIPAFTFNPPVTQAFQWPSLDPAMLTPRTSRETSPLAINYTHSPISSSRPNLQAALSQSLGKSPDHWALTVQHNTGEVKHFTSSSLSPYCDDVLTTKFAKRFKKYTERADGPKPQQIEYNSGYYSEESSTSLRPQSRVGYHDWDSDESGEFVLAQKRRRRQPHWNSDSEESEEEFIAPLPSIKKKPTTIRIDNDKELEKFYRARLIELQSTPCKILAKAFVKVVEPRKQSRYPYSKGQINAPPWWPALSGTNSVRHKEPDHLFKQERIQLLIHILRMSVQPVASQHPSFQDQDISVQKLEDVSYEALTSWFQDPENPENIFRAPLIKELFKVAKYEERYKNGEIDADTKISVMYLGSLEEESGEDEDVAATDVPPVPASGEVENETPGSARYEATLRWDS
ncbi:hypothetical protein BKA64DRAFT_714496 [Cadophora sp. MPI-SDFR-AT-0126]|nr:hypothetical protein BKA64DRAFT_714496 [Leotiomycetes sp. MPI-SDFR-AT-0126]